MVPSFCPNTSAGINAGADVIVYTVNPEHIGTKNPIALPFGINAIINNAAIVDIPDITIGTNDPSLSNNLPPATLPIKHATPNIEPATPNFAGSNPFCPNTGIACVDTETTAKHLHRKSRILDFYHFLYLINHQILLLLVFHLTF